MANESAISPIEQEACNNVAIKLLEEAKANYADHNEEIDYIESRIADIKSGRCISTRNDVLTLARTVEQSRTSVDKLQTEYNCPYNFYRNILRLVVRKLPRLGELSKADSMIYLEKFRLEKLKSKKDE